MQMFGASNARFVVCVCWAKCGRNYAHPPAHCAAGYVLFWCFGHSAQADFSTLVALVAVVVALQSQTQISIMYDVTGWDLRATIEYVAVGRHGHAGVL